ncbi:MAG TPA: hypothetical protein VD767_11315, partial [Thermomicrobiales bacterium]|nr:hypothetical protein [Thermomicrobiales bacterium]
MAERSNASKRTTRDLPNLPPGMKGDDEALFASARSERSVFARPVSPSGPDDSNPGSIAGRHGQSTERERPNPERRVPASR